MMDMGDFNFDQARKLLIAEPNLVPKIFVMNTQTRSLFRLSEKSHLIIVDQRDGHHDLTEMYGKQVFPYSKMPDNVLGLFLPAYLFHVVENHTDWDPNKISEWMASDNYIKNAPFRISNIGYIEVGEVAYSHMISDPISLSKHKFIETEIY